MHHWRKSSYSGEDAEHNCVELGRTPGAILLRESDEPQTVITMTPAALRALTRAVRDGRFDQLSR